MYGYMYMYNMYNMYSIFFLQRSGRDKEGIAGVEGLGEKKGDGYASSCT